MLGWAKQYLEDNPVHHTYGYGVREVITGEGKTMWVGVREKISEANTDETATKWFLSSYQYKTLNESNERARRYREEMRRDSELSKVKRPSDLDGAWTSARSEATLFKSAKDCEAVMRNTIYQDWVFTE